MTSHLASLYLCISCSLSYFLNYQSTEHLRKEFEDMIGNFAEAWDLLKGEIGTFGKSQYCLDNMSIQLL
jgi:hypothetical protein